ncbi:MAG: GNAT family N-acetyltransferase [Candidatus Omnitrophica bacterium]|nr:GNAT family N-acetyltransferase [Candidatus Omnitrophota bacterium]
MNTKNLNIRDFEKKDTDNILNFWKEVFSYDESTIKILKDMIEADMNNEVFSIRIMEDNHKIIGTTCTKKRLIKFGSASLLCGDVGYVAISPQLQGKGLGTILMQDNSEYLVKKGFHIARLGGLHRFYSRFGYVPIVSKYWQFNTRDIKAGTKKFKFEDITGLNSGELECIRRMDKLSDWKECINIEEKCHVDSYGYEPLMSPLISLQLNRKFDDEIERFVYQKDRQIMAFMMIYNRKLIFSYGYLPQHYDELIALLKYVLSLSKYEGKTVIKVFFPLVDIKLADNVLRHNIEFEIVEKYSAIAGNMIKIVNIEGIIDAMYNEIKRLLPDTGKLTIEFSDIKKSFSLHLNEGTDRKITTCTEEFINWLKGSNVALIMPQTNKVLSVGYPKYTEF